MKMKRMALGILALALSASVYAHNQYFYTESLDISGKTETKMSLLFGHPSEGTEEGLILIGGVDGKVNPVKEFFVLKDGKDKKDLKDKITEGTMVTDKNTVSTIEYNFTQEEGLKGKGLWTFFMVPGITKDEGWEFNFYNKVILVKEGASGGWTDRIADGYPEIIPYSNPANMWTEDVFRARLVDENGKPMSNIRVDYDFLNAEVDLVKGTYKGGNPEMPKVSNKVYTDENGNFAFSPSKAGKWVLRARAGMDFEKKISYSASLVVEFK